VLFDLEHESFPEIKGSEEGKAVGREKEEVPRCCDTTL